MTWMTVITVVVLVLPFVLMVLFNRRDAADARGRRISRRWQVRRFRPATKSPDART